ncbi:polysaccharide deacetylase family protein [Nocardioides sp. LMS-CY]|uniref:polysaccharide deacetylase family protein n=1 Tax=Nocardioides sp. (strain LMS-CY) TaxID=2840457 RepID=UPI001C006A5A|nr:polysaccharide deacetylase family protein [Nocardioides sp. LMS-CY]QWF22957.1 polysaccharide deacetylase family protein [Nocardioides sp. LMS-CY]
MPLDCQSMNEERTALTRDLVGYGRNGPDARWPNGARLAVSLVLNYEEGSERTFENGDDSQETSTEWGQYDYPPTTRNLAMESVYEYGSRVGVWRLLDLVTEFDVPLTFFACAQALERNSEVAEWIRDRPRHEVCSHGYRWEEVFRLSEAQERSHIDEAIRSLERTVGRRPLGWYCRYGASERTRRLLEEVGGFVYDSDSYADDAPYFVEGVQERRLVVPYTPDANDFRFWQANGPVTARQFSEYLVDTFEQLYREGESSARMMSIGLHPRIIGRPGRVGSLRSFLEHARQRDGVWFATRLEIAEAWLTATGGAS